MPVDDDDLTRIVHRATDDDTVIVGREPAAPASVDPDPADTDTDETVIVSRQPDDDATRIGSREPGGDHTRMARPRVLVPTDPDAPARPPSGGVSAYRAPEAPSGGRVAYGRRTLPRQRPEPLRTPIAPAPQVTLPGTAEDIRRAAAARVRRRRRTVIAVVLLATVVALTLAAFAAFLIIGL